MQGTFRFARQPASLAGGHAALAMRPFGQLLHGIGGAPRHDIGGASVMQLLHALRGGFLMAAGAATNEASVCPPPPP